MHQKQSPVPAPSSVTKPAQPKPSNRAPSTTPVASTKRNNGSVPSKKRPPTSPVSPAPEAPARKPVTNTAVPPPKTPKQSVQESEDSHKVPAPSKKRPPVTKKPAAKTDNAPVSKSPVKSKQEKPSNKKLQEPAPEKPQKTTKSKKPVTTKPTLNDQPATEEVENFLPKYGAVCVHNFQGNYGILAWMQPGDPKVLEGIAPPNGKLVFIGDMQKMSSQSQPNYNLSHSILDSVSDTTNNLRKESSHETAQTKPAPKPAKKPPASAEKPPKKPAPPKINLYIVEQLYQQELSQMDTEGMSQKELTEVKKRCRAAYEADREEYKKQYSQEFAEYKSNVLGIVSGEKRKSPHSKEPPKKKKKNGNYSNFDEVAKDVWEIFFQYYLKRIVKHSDYTREDILEAFTQEVVSCLVEQISKWLETCCTLDATKNELNEFVQENYGIIEKMVQDMNHDDSDESSADNQESEIPVSKQKGMFLIIFTLPPHPLSISCHSLRFIANINYNSYHSWFNEPRSS